MLRPTNHAAAILTQAQVRHLTGQVEPQLESVMFQCWPRSRAASQRSLGAYFHRGHLGVLKRRLNAGQNLEVMCDVLLMEVDLAYWPGLMPGCLEAVVRAADMRIGGKFPGALLTKILPDAPGPEAPFTAGYNET